MNKQQQQVKARKDWLKIHLESGSVTKTALRCGIARSTLHLSDKLRRPKTLTNTMVTK